MTICLALILCVTGTAVLATGSDVDIIDVTIPSYEGVGSGSTTDTLFLVVVAAAVAAAPILIRAAFGRNRYFIRYDDGFGTWRIDRGGRADGEGGRRFTVTSDRPERSGYEFSEWNTEVDGIGKPYVEGQTVTLYADAPTLTLYAMWRVARLNPDDL